MILKSIDLIRKFKKDKANQNIDLTELEIMAKNFDDSNKLEWEKLEIKKERMVLENEKLKLEIAKLKKDKLFTTSDGTSFKISDVETIDRNNDNDEYPYYVQLSTKNKSVNFVSLTEEGYGEFLKVK